MPGRANEAPPHAKPSNYPQPFASMMAGCVKRPLGDIFGLGNFGVTHVSLAAGAVSALHHRHNVQDEFVFVISGTVTLMHDAGETVLTAGMYAGFPRGGAVYHLVSRSEDAE